MLMLFAALTELKFGMDAEGKPLESIANPFILGKLVIAFDQRARRKTDCGSASPPRLRQAGFFRSFDLSGDRAKGGERGFVVPIGSFTIRRPGLRTVACHLGLDHPLYSFLPLRIPGLIFKVRRH
ncbi:MAG: hypothetical protein WCE28_00575 [Bradyrhizobium sp.]